MGHVSIYNAPYHHTMNHTILQCLIEFHTDFVEQGEVGGWGRVPFSRNLMKPTPRRKWYLTTGRRFH